MQVARSSCSDSASFPVVRQHDGIASAKLGFSQPANAAFQVQRLTQHLIEESQLGFPQLRVASECREIGIRSPPEPGEAESEGVLACHAQLGIR